MQARRASRYERLRELRHGLSIEEGRDLIGDCHLILGATAGEYYKHKVRK